MFLTDFHTQKYTGGIILQVGIFLTVTLDAPRSENLANGQICLVPRWVKVHNKRAVNIEHHLNYKY